MPNSQQKTRSQWWVLLPVLSAARKAFASLMADGKLTTFWSSIIDGTAPCDLLPATQFHTTGYPLFPMATFPLRRAPMQLQEEEAAAREGGGECRRGVRGARGGRRKRSDGAC
ncbi:hypothetical protein F7725_021814 [Dissostichus mawsoni]|uniref:Uncharacterized protein n=1 Tax=Dissostichus mawsoni TaxID=36200 RepID=A0A7J5ZC97_DISMA|nr:hypothetical protein F7725_021814 [Dissostichus mawsoni]